MKTLSRTFRLDMTMMFAVHDAFRRDLAHVTDMTGPSLGWDLFDRMLHLHHSVEDDELWPVVRSELPGHRDDGADAALLDAMTAEHATLGPLLVSISTSLDHGNPTAEPAAELATRLQEHLAHEESEALPLIDRTLPKDQYQPGG